MDVTAVRHLVDAGNLALCGSVMDAALEIPDDLAEQAALNVNRTLGQAEAFALEDFRAGRITAVELRQTLGLGRLQLDAFLKSRGIYEEVTLEDVERDIADLKACLRA